MQVAIVGAGLAGLACAAVLEGAGITVSLLDKGKRPGGRLSTLKLGERQWDFGAQYFVARDPRFAAQAARWKRQGVAERWWNGPAGAMVGVPAMSALVEAECAARDVRFNALVQRIERKAEGWRVVGPGLDAGGFDALVVAVPAEQAAALLSLHDLTLAREAAAVRSSPCWTAMIGFDQPLGAGPAYMREFPPIAWAARGSAKPGRPGGETWVVQADPQWSREHLERTAEDVASLLFEALAHGIGELPSPAFLKAHRWRFARPAVEHELLPWNPAIRLGACGDWCGAPTIEAAWLSGHRLGIAVAEALRPGSAGKSAAQDLQPSASEAPASRVARAAAGRA